MAVEAVPAEELVEPDPTSFAVPGQAAATEEEIQITAVTPGARPGAGQGAVQVFKRGQFTFNRRFMESKFAGYLSEVRSAADANTTLLVKTTSSQSLVERIVSIGASEMQVEVALGEIRQAVTIPFADIQEIQIKSKAE
jgi:hypothetical protein